MDHGYTGRFAPSPTGPLHMGSLVAAVGSYLQARKHQGTWLLRMEDLDPPREEPGAAERILRSLEVHGLYWDGEIIYQSQRHEAYQAAIETLLEQQLAYPCYCSRKQIRETAQQGKYGLIYPGTCRHISNRQDQQFSIRVRTDNVMTQFTDQRVGNYGQQLESELGDFIIKRSDGFYAYQLAVVIDDEYQQITEVVRGEDLLNNTPRQIHLQRLLNLPTPAYCHLPLVRNQQGEKLSKQTYAPALDDQQATKNLVTATEYLGIEIPLELHGAQAEEILKQAVDDWVLP